jgi:hypothetical protein
MSGLVPRAGILHDLNLSALTLARGLLLVRKSTRPRVRLERDVQQCVAVPRIPDEIHELLATWAVASPQRPDCVPLLSPWGSNGHPASRLTRHVSGMCREQDIIRQCRSTIRKRNKRLLVNRSESINLGQRGNFSNECSDDFDCR